MRTAKIFTACAMGSLIGAFVALKLQPLWWWLGLVIGGFAGYLSYEPMAVVKGLIRAGKTAWKASKWRFKFENEEAKRDFITLFNVMSVAVSLFCVFLLLPLIIHEILIDAKDAWPMIYLTSVIPLGMGLFAGWLEIVCPSIKDEKDRTRYENFVATWNPVKILFYWIPKGVWEGGWTAVKGIGKGICFLPFLICELGLLLARFSRFFFLFIHSDIRLLCGMDAAIGALIGLKTGSPIIGALAGGIIGVINYQLVTVRLLKPYLSKIKY